MLPGFASCNLKMLPTTWLCFLLSKDHIFVENVLWWQFLLSSLPGGRVIIFLQTQPPAHQLEIDEAAASLGHFYQSNLRKLLLYRNECLGLKVHSIEMLTCIASLNIENLALVFAMITVS